LKGYAVEYKQAIAIVGSLSKPSKMPGYAIGIPAGKAQWVEEYAAKDDTAIPLPAYGCAIGAKLTSIKGSTCNKCYAMKGNYAFKNVKQAQYKRLKGIFHPQWVDAMVEVLYMTVDPNEPYFRWHDSGDIVSLEHLERIVEVCKRTKYIRHWLPTREAGIVKEYLTKYQAFPHNLTVRLSSTMIDGKPYKFYPITSTVHTKESLTGHSCPAYTQDGKCGDCRACWDSKVKNVSYPKH